MGVTSYAVKLSSEVKELVKRYCRAKGLKQGRFVEAALLEKIEKEEDIEDAFEFERLQSQEARAVDFEEYLLSRKK